MRIKLRNSDIPVHIKKYENHKFCFFETTHVSFDGLMSPHMLRQMPFEHFVANLAVKCFNVFVIARNVLFQGVAPIKCLRTNMAHKVAFV